ncbi:DMT family transporter [Actibacterium lipolyticum]|uniref:Putative inner membrane transporter yiJE n=1 Tax=Actibacterium lipolyticum TaxID=1524263 RepID=A0A238KID5_9RHOB|nr:DMT family transporter [Actibacterium lipolyticum]SMX41866.1 putative inner membrane transporter yiJE [Actibacterium lipolyticum]
MARKDHIDAFGAASLIGFSALLGFNQVVIKITNVGIQPVFFAGVRSAGAVVCIWLFLRLMGKRLDLRRETIPAGLLIGAVFSVEFIGLFLALDLTTVTRTSVIFYTMPVWLAIAAHFLLPGERITPIKGVGLGLAFLGVAWAILDRGNGGGQASLLGDLCALMAAFGWAGIALCARATKLNQVAPETQLFWQVAVSAPVLLLLAPLFGPLLRDLQPIHLWGLGFQIVVIVSAGFMFWLWLLSIYPAAGVASFSFLSPIFGVGFGWLMLDEHIGPSIIGPLVLVAVGILLINRKGRPQVPQKV